MHVMYARHVCTYVGSILRVYEASGSMHTYVCMYVCTCTGWPLPYIRSFSTRHKDTIHLLRRSRNWFYSSVISSRSMNLGLVSMAHAIIL